MVPKNKTEFNSLWICCYVCDENLHHLPGNKRFILRSFVLKNNSKIYTTQWFLRSLRIECILCIYNITFY